MKYEYKGYLVIEEDDYWAITGDNKVFFAKGRRLHDVKTFHDTPNNLIDNAIRYMRNICGKGTLYIWCKQK